MSYHPLDENTVVDYILQRPDMSEFFSSETCPQIETHPFFEIKLFIPLASRYNAFTAYRNARGCR